MKKILALLLTASFGMFAVSCGKEPQTPNDSENVAGVTVTGESSAVTDTAPLTDTEQQQTTSSDRTDKPSFDTSHAKNDFERLIPKLPFDDGWTVIGQTDTEYKLQIIGLNTSAATNPENSGEPDGADKTTLLTYLSSLSEYGFAVEETGAGYRWVVTDQSANEIEFMIGDGGCWVTIKKA